MNRGPKRKPTALHVVDGTFKPSRHGEIEASEPQPEGQLEKPKWLKQRVGGQVWDEWAPELTWLKRIDSEKFAGWCKLAQAVRERDPFDIPAAYWSQWRTIASELGFDPSGRARIGASGKPKTVDPTSKFF